jgi:tetratricopeptide (TPR) repeat protein
MKKSILLIIVILINCLSIKTYSQNAGKEKDIDISIIKKAAKRAYYENNDYGKAISILSKAANYLQLKKESKYEDIIDVSWTQIQITLLEKGAVIAQPLVENLMKSIEAYHAKLATGFSYSDNAQNLLFSDNISKNFIYYPNGIQVIGSMFDSFIEIYKKDFSGEEQLRIFQSSRSYIYLLNGNLKSALDLSADIMAKSDESEKCMYAINYGHVLFLNKQGTEKAIEQYKAAFKLDEQLIAKSLLMDFQTLRQFHFDLSVLKDYESQIKAKYLKKYYKRPYVKEAMSNSVADKVGLKAGDVIELYNNNLVYDIEMFCNERRSERFKQDQKPREIKVLRNGQHLTFTVVPGLLGVYLDYEK